jgi:hypothetical protein
LAAAWVTLPPASATSAKTWSCRSVTTVQLRWAETHAGLDDLMRELYERLESPR